MAQGPMESALLSEDPIAKLTDDILVDIISRVPYKSTCCCKCVSTSWRDLFSHPDHRKKLPQPLAGFFHLSYNKIRFPEIARYFTNLSGKGHPLFNPSLSFLPRYESLYILDGCNGLLLCRCWKDTDTKTLDYVVCNPATEKWVVVPATDWSSEVEVARLGFEPTVSSHFHVFEFIDEHVWGIAESEKRSLCDSCIETLAIYSSEAGVWKLHCLNILKFSIPDNSKAVFLNGILHLAAWDRIVAVDVEGHNSWFIDIPMSPYYDWDDHDYDVAIFLWQRQLCFAKFHSVSDGSELSVWALGALEDYNSEQWTLKHNVSHLELFEDVSHLELFEDSSFADYNVISFHPERNMIFIVRGQENTLLSYDMDGKKLCFICELGQECRIAWSKTPYIPYVPLYSETLADGH